MSKALDLDFVRKQYPARRWDTPFFENAGGAFVPYTVIKRMADYMSEAQVQTGYPFSVSKDASVRVSLGHSRIAELVGADSDEIVLGPSTSMNIYVLAQALRPLFKEGDEIIVSMLNHESNSGPWRRLSEFGLKIVEWPVDKSTGALDPNSLERLLTSKTRLVAFPQVSNITGDINDVVAITSKAHSVGAMVCVDGVAFAPHRQVDVKTWNVDFYLFSFYKVFGPHLGLLYCRKDRLEAAAGQYHYFFSEHDLAHKLNPAGPNHETIASLTGITDYLDSLYQHHFGDDSKGSRLDRMQLLFDLFSQHEETLAKYFLDFVSSESGIRLIGTNKADLSARVPTFSIQLTAMTSSQAAHALAQENIACGYGHFYAKRLLDSLDILEPEVLRCSMAHYTNLEDVDCLITGLQKLLARGSQT